MAESRIGWGPVCAGTTRPSVPPRRMPGGHPRVRGVHPFFAFFHARWTGPSPRARGTLGGSGHGAVRRGSIPACAGTTVAVVIGCQWLRGPSPRARGPPLRWPWRNPPAGSIPACAGTTAPRSSSSAPTRVHPRVRGDHHQRLHKRCPKVGPSPRARGPRLRRHLRNDPLGSIPACAGTTRISLRIEQCARVHPRVRGDHALPQVDGRSGEGPSPRARGPQFVTCGFIRPGCCFYLLLEKRTYPPRF